MRLDNTQIRLEDWSEEYAEFLEKFKPKKTTDDCYTPDNVYKAVLDWVVKEYGIDPEKVDRPFWPGGDYERFEYTDGGCVVDNPPFSILSQICTNYRNAGIKFFLFAPYLTNFGGATRGLTHIVCDADVMYENGATVNTSFITNLDVWEVRTASDLRAAIVEADKANRKEMRRELPKYDYPDEVLTATMVGYLSKYGQEFKLMPNECFFIRALESQRAKGKAIFGGGYLLSKKAAAEKAAAEKAAAEKAAAEKWKLSEKELGIIESLGGTA